MGKKGLFLILAIGFLLCGCSPASVRWHNKRIRSEPASKEEPNGKHRLSFKWMRQGRNIQVFAKKISLCQQINGEKVTLRPIRTAKARTGNYWIALALGLGAPVVGVGLIVAPPLDGNTPKERADMKTTQGVLGWTFVIGGGVAGLAILIGTAVSAKTTYRKPFVRFDEFEKKTGDCEYPPPAPAASEVVTLSIGGSKVSKAITDSKGVASLSLPGADQLGQYSKDQVKKTQVSMSGAKIQIDLSETATYRAAAKEAARLARLKAEEAARMAREEKKRRRRAIAEAKAKRTELLKKLRAKMLKRPRVMYAKGIEPSCETPSAPCSGMYLVENKEYKVVARTPKHWGVAECGDRAPCTLADIRLWALRKHMESKNRHLARLRREKRKEAARKRRILAIRRRVSRLRVQQCKQLRARGWRGSCRLVAGLRVKGASFRKAMFIAARLHRNLALVSRYPSSAGWVVSCLFSGTYVQTLMLIEKGATESNMASLTSCLTNYGQTGILIFSRSFGLPISTSKVILDIYQNNIGLP